MATPADDRSRMLGGAVAFGAVLAGLLFLVGIAKENWWALAVPVAVLVLFVLGLVFWIGWTIATIRVEASGEALVPAGGPSAAPTPDPAPTESEREA